METQKSLLSLLSGEKTDNKSNEQAATISVVEEEKKTETIEALTNVQTRILSKIRDICTILKSKYLDLRKKYIEDKNMEKVLKENRKIIMTVIISVICTIIVGVSAVGIDYMFTLGVFFDKKFILLAKSNKNLEKYYRLEPRQLHQIWNDTLQDFDKKNTSKDLSARAVIAVLNKLGASMKPVDTSVLVNKINSYREVKFSTSTITYGGKVSTGDLIIFKPTWQGQKQIFRVGLVQEVVNGYVKCMEWNQILGINYPSLKINDPSILMIVEISNLIWTNTSLQNGIRITQGISWLHEGVDLKLSNYDRNVYAFTDGQVIKVYNKYIEARRWELENSGGNYVVIRMQFNGKTYDMKYMHLLNLGVYQGQYIKKDTYIGKYADIGYCFGAHLHISMYDKGIPVDPTPLLTRVASFVIYGYEDSRAYVAKEIQLDTHI